MENNENSLDPEVIEKKSADLATILDNMSVEEKYFRIAVFTMLLGHERVHQFINSNYAIHKQIDEKKKTINLGIEENPDVVIPTPKLLQQSQVMSVLGLHGVKDTGACFKAIMRVLGQEEKSESGVVLTDHLRFK